MPPTRSPLSARLRALANPRVIAIAALAGAGVLYLRKHQAASSSSALQGDTLPVDPSSASTDPFAGTDLSSGIGLGTPATPLDPVTLDPGQSVYNPNTGQFVTAPDNSIADTQTTDQSGGQTTPAAPGNVIAAKANKRKGGKFKLPKTQTSHLPSSFDPSPIVRRVLGKPAIARATQIAHLGRVGQDRHLPALAHPPSRSNVKRAATVVTGAAVRTAPRPKGAKRKNAPPALKKTFPTLHAGEAREGPAAARPVQSARPVSQRTGRGSAASALLSRRVATGHPATAARRDVVRHVVRKKARR